jgi:NitT/TauT family transport system permease protein
MRVPGQRPDWAKAYGITLVAVVGVLLVASIFVDIPAALRSAGEGEAVGVASKVIFLVSVWLSLWGINIFLASRVSGRFGGTAVALIFGGTILLLWEMAVRLFDVPTVILPPPSMIAERFVQSLPVLWGDFVQTILKGALGGYVIGVLAAFATALLVDRFGFLKRGLLPVGNFMAALPIVGTAPILVMWFGFGWQSKAAVVVLMIYFPMLVNTVAGLADTSAMQRDLMRTYGAGWWGTLVKLRLPAALPFIFNGLKISTTLALIGAIVAEFFGSPTLGLGFRISTSIGQLDLAMVWAAIVVSALAGTVIYGIATLIERRMTFWHPSQRR